MSRPKVLIVFYSRNRSTELLAEAAAAFVLGPQPSAQ